MELTEKLLLWGTTHAAAREMARAAEASGAEERRRQAAELRMRADRLHREIYSELGRPRGERHG